MRICIDLRTADNGIHGIARYGMELARALVLLRSDHQFYLLTGCQGSLARGEIPYASVICSSARPYSLKEQLLVPLRLAPLRFDLYHCVTYACPVLVPCPLIITLHDLLPLERPHEFSTTLRLYWNTWVRLAARRSRRIVTDSNSSALSIKERLAVPPGRVHAIPLGGDHIRHNEISEQDRHKFREINPGSTPYFLSVANERPHKNIHFSVQCFFDFKRIAEEKVLYFLVGRQHPDVYALVKDHPLGQQIRILEFVSDGLLRLLYQDALALLCPSVGEGFFLPAVEAMQFGIPVLAARAGALPEVLGSEGILITPGRHEEWRAAIEGVYQQRRQGRWRGAQVQERAGTFTWEKTAKMTLALYEQAVSS